MSVGRPSLPSLRRRPEVDDGAPRYHARRHPLWGHAPALRSAPETLLSAARAQLGDALRLDVADGFVTVVTGHLAEELAGRPSLPLGDERYLLSAPLEGPGPLLWRPEPTFDEGAPQRLQEALAPARLRAPLERFAQALEAQLETWPPGGELIPRAVAALRPALAAALVAPGRAPAAERALQEFMDELPSDTPGPLTRWPNALRLDLAARACQRFSRRMAPLLEERRSRAREASGLLDGLAAQVGSRLAGRLGARVVWILALGLPRQVAAQALALVGDDESRELLLEEQDLLHGDQGDVTYETVRQARHLEERLVAIGAEHAVGSPAAWRLARVEADLRVGRWRVKDGEWLLSPAHFGRADRGDGQALVEQLLGRPCLLVCWSVLLRRLHIDAATESLAYLRHDLER